MPIVTFQGQRIPCNAGTNLRELLAQRGLAPHNGMAKLINCRGFGSCGTCAVAIRGQVSAMTLAERIRLSLPPHNPNHGLRLACQCQVMGDIDVTKYEGLWGQQIDRNVSRPLRLQPWRTSRG